MQDLEEFQDFGEIKPIIRSTDMVGASGVQSITPDEDKSFADASEAFREVLDEYYSEWLDNIEQEDERLVIERLILQSDDIPYIEYTIVDELENDE